MHYYLEGTNMRSEKTYSNVSEMLIEKIFGLNYQIASELHANRRLKRARLQSTINKMYR